MTTPTITIDLDSITVILDAEEIAGLGHLAISEVAHAMQTVADRLGLDVDVVSERTSGSSRDEDPALWERLAIDHADDVRAIALGHRGEAMSRRALTHAEQVRLAADLAAILRQLVAVERVDDLREWLDLDAELSVQAGEPTIDVVSHGESTCVDNPGAVDATVLVSGVAHEVTLIPSEHSGELDMWGDRDNWISGPDAADLSRETLTRIVDAVVAAVAS